MKRLPWRRLGRRLREPFPALGGNSIVPIAKGDDFFDRMRDAIRAAGATVDVEMYLWDDDVIGRGFVEALASAADRGLRVRVLVDDNGAKRVRRREGPWHDRMFEIRGPVVRHLVRMFEADHSRWRERPHGDHPPPPDATLELRTPGHADLRLMRGWPDARDFPAELLRAIRNSTTRVWLGSPYFIPPPKLIMALRKALKRGVEVRLVLPSGNYAHPLLWYASRRHYAFFLKRGAQIHEFADGFYHAKLAVVDDAAALVGSSNLDYWSWNRNAEIDLLATDAATVETIAKCFDEDVARSRVVTLAELGLRDWWTRWKEALVGVVEAWL
jgi:cardiolipin synthase